MKRLWKALSLAPLLALCVSGLASAQQFFPQTPQFPANCIYLPTPTPYPQPTSPTAMVLRCDKDGILQTTGGGGGGGGNVTIVGPLGTTTKAGSVSITIASDQGSIPVSITLPFTGGATGVTAAAGQSLGIAAYNGTTMDALKSTSGALNVNISSQTGLSPVIVTTPAPAPTGAHGAVIVEGVASGTVVPISGTVTANAGSGTFAISGTVTANAGTGNFSIIPPLTGVSGTGTAQAVNQAIVASCAFNSSLPTITTGNVGPQQCDTSGRQIMVGAGTAGSAAGGVVTVQGVASGTNLNVAVGAALPAGGNTIGAVTQASGPWTITPPLTGANSTGTAGAAAQSLVGSCNFTTSPATLTSGNVGPVNCDSKGNQQVVGTGTAGAAAGGVLTVQGVASGTGLNVAEPLTGANSTGTAGAAGQSVVASCNFTTAPATVTSGNVVPITCDNKGGIIIGAGAASIGIIKGPVTGANGTGTAGAVNQAMVASCNFTTSPATLTSGNVGPINCDSLGNTQVVGKGTVGTPSGGVLTVQGGSAGNVLTTSVSQWNGATLGSPGAVGVVGAANVLTVNSVNSASTVGGATKANFVNLAGTVQSIKSSAGTLYGVQVWNGTGATAFLQLFNVATGSVTLGTTVPDLQFVCPTLTYCFAPIPSTIGTDFATAISVASTTAVSGASGSASGVYLYAQYK